MSQEQDKKMDDATTGSTHSGPKHSAPYPVSRLAPAFDLVDLAAEIARADAAIGQRVSSKLQVIADQVKSLQAQARAILEQAEQDTRLHQARCAFQRKPGKVYHLYRRADGGQEFSMLAPSDWGGTPPHEFLGSYRLEHDMSWTSADEIGGRAPSSVVLERLLEIPPEG